jgi:hypothetical protein
MVDCVGHNHLLVLVYRVELLVDPYSSAGTRANVEVLVEDEEHVTGDGQLLLQHQATLLYDGPRSDAVTSELNDEDTSLLGCDLFECELFQGFHDRRLSILEFLLLLSYKTIKVDGIVDCSLVLDKVVLGAHLEDLYGERRDVLELNVKFDRFSVQERFLIVR